MAKPHTPPTGRLSSKRRSFEEVVRDLRHTVFSVIRIRQLDGGMCRGEALGSGFFVSHDIFLTCSHVINPAHNPHIDGDAYRLVALTDGNGSGVHHIGNAKTGHDIFLYPDSDLGLLRCTGRADQPFVALEYGSVPVGKDIGVAGYPLPQLAFGNGDLQYGGLIFRVARGVVNSTYSGMLNTDQGALLANIPVLEVNFLFVPGNSGGPVFDSETGRVTAFVHGYIATKIRERVEQITMINPLPADVPGRYVENLNAVYSVAIRMERVRPQLEALGVAL
jgi:hypothetical protein